MTLAGTRTASLDAQVLLGSVLNRGRAWLLAHGEERIGQSEFERFCALVARRSVGEPVAYLRGFVNWLDLELEVSPDVLIPRPDTETLAEEAIRLGRELDVGRVVDVGTGSGALAIALSRGLPAAKVTAIDVSGVALKIAARNVARYGLEKRIRLLRGDLLEPLSAPPDLLVANLPYLSDAMMATIDVDVQHEPELALHGGPSGLELYRRLIGQLMERQWFCPMFLEIDSRQFDGILSLLSTVPGGECGILVDLSGRKRVAWYRPETGHV